MGRKIEKQSGEEEDSPGGYSAKYGPIYSKRHRPDKGKSATWYAARGPESLKKTGVMKQPKRKR
jgi:hypothetical protein